MWRFISQDLSFLTASPVIWFPSDVFSSTDGPSTGRRIKLSSILQTCLTPSFFVARKECTSFLLCSANQDTSMREWLRLGRHLLVRHLKQLQQQPDKYRQSLHQLDSEALLYVQRKRLHTGILQTLHLHTSQPPFLHLDRFQHLHLHQARCYDQAAYLHKHPPRIQVLDLSIFLKRCRTSTFHGTASTTQEVALQSHLHLQELLLVVFR